MFKPNRYDVEMMVAMVVLSVPVFLIALVIVAVTMLLFGGVPWE